MKPIRYTPAALKALGKLPKPARSSILAKLERYAESGAGDVRALAGRDGTRLRVGNYRIVFVEMADAIEVLAVGHRRDVYE